jgi:hypothetical protein
LRSSKDTDNLDVGGETIKHWLQTWIRNATVNHHKLCPRFKDGRAIEISVYPKVLDKPCLIVGSGPTLDQYTDASLEIKRAIHEKFTIFCGTSNANVFRRFGYHPDYVVIVDSNSEVAKHIGILDPTKTTIVTTPCVEPKVIDRWKGKLIIFKPVQTGEKFITDILPKMYSNKIEFRPGKWAHNETFYSDILKLGFLNVGCTPNASIEIANYLGYDPQFLLGCDMAYIDGKIRAKMFSNQDLSPLPEHPLIHLSEHIRLGNGQITNEEMMVYKSNLLLVYYMALPQLFIVGEKGGITTDEIPHISFEGLLKDRDFHKLYIPDDEIRKRCSTIMKEDFNTLLEPNFAQPGTHNISKIKPETSIVPQVDWKQKHDELQGILAERTRVHSETIKALMDQLHQGTENG